MARSRARVRLRSFVSVRLRPRPCIYVRVRESAFVRVHIIKRPDASGCIDNDASGRVVRSRTFEMHYICIYMKHMYFFTCTCKCILYIVLFGARVCVCVRSRWSAHVQHSQCCLPSSSVLLRKHLTNDQVEIHVHVYVHCTCVLGHLWSKPEPLLSCWCMYMCSTVLFHYFFVSLLHVGTAHCPTPAEVLLAAPGVNEMHSRRSRKKSRTWPSTSPP